MGTPGTAEQVKNMIIQKEIAIFQKMIGSQSNVESQTGRSSVGLISDGHHAAGGAEAAPFG